MTKIINLVVLFLTIHRKLSLIIGNSTASAVDQVLDTYPDYNKPSQYGIGNYPANRGRDQSYNGVLGWGRYPCTDINEGCRTMPS